MSDLAVWLSPAGRYHRHRICSSNGQRRATRKITINREELRAIRQQDHSRVCRCLSLALEEEES